MSRDVHDQYCGSFGKFSDCPECYSPDEPAAKPKRKRKLGEPMPTGDWVQDAINDIEYLMKTYFPKGKQQ